MEAALMAINEHVFIRRILLNFSCLGGDHVKEPRSSPAKNFYDTQSICSRTVELKCSEIAM